MIILAVIGAIIIILIACIGLVCALFDSDELRNMGICL